MDGAARFEQRYIVFLHRRDVWGVAIYGSDTQTFLSLCLSRISTYPILRT